MDPVQAYAVAIRTAHASGAASDEVSHYGALETLLNEAGSVVKPKVRCIINPANSGAGIPDGALFTADQLSRDAEPLPGQMPARGAVEVKAPGADLDAIALTQQVRRYVDHYGVVLLTNYWDFRLLEADERGEPHLVEDFQLAENEPAFWGALAHPRRLSREQGPHLLEFLRRAALHRAPITRPRDLAWFLASYARDARIRLETRSDLPALATVRSGLEDALGVKFEGAKGEHFFRSTLVQTLFYGLFSAWVLWHGEDEGRTDDFDWRLSPHYLHLPVMQALYHQLAQPARLTSLDLHRWLGLAGAALNRVDRQAFFANFEREHAVQYFYEPFLEAYDPELRKQLGVWYTPPEVVRYMVARVDTALRTELGVADGLADPNVYVLDPCCGTGAYLVETLRVIAERLQAQGANGLMAQDLKKAATERVFGFEILPAPFVVAHLQLGLFLQGQGAPLSEEGGERAGVYLTNALTGWEAPDAAKNGLQLRLSGMPELQEERDAAEKVKREVPILVVMGNPPYNGFAGMAMGEERDLTDAYRTTVRAAAPQGQGLNDLYVRFYRMAERRITEKTKKGIVCFISNYSWLDGLSFTGMRERYLDAFDRVWVDCLNGDKYKTGKLTPEGDPDPSIFSTESNREGIQVGTGIALLVRKNDHQPAPWVQFRHLWGRGKLNQLAQEAEGTAPLQYDSLNPPLGLGLPFTPVTAETEYLTWPQLPDLLPVYFAGPKTSRDEALVDIDRERLEARMRKYFDSSISHQEVRIFAPVLIRPANRFEPVTVREHLLMRGFLPDKIVRYCYRPFDVRWLYWEPETKLLAEKSADYFEQVDGQGVWLVTQRRPRRSWSSPQVIRALGCLDLMDRGASSVPLRVRRKAGHQPALDGPDGSVWRPNLTDLASTYVSQVLHACPETVFYHVVAIMHAPSYAAENAGALRQDWPRIPLPADRDLLLASADLGRQVAALLDPETPVPGVTAGEIRPELRGIAVPQRADGGQLRPDQGDLDVTAGWGHAGRGGITMPGRGKLVERAYTPEEKAALGEARAQLGERTLDVYLNDVALWSNVPEAVWEYTIGGYQVMKKWLSYRERPLLGRALKPEEVREVQAMARRIAALLMLGPALDASYRAVKAATYAWPGDG